jgi:cystathionine beta-lyase/cystathionine gamma-synthase
MLPSLLKLELVSLSLVSLAEQYSPLLTMSIYFKALGIDDRLVRLSVGIEDLRDLLKDLDRGLNSALLKNGAS